MNFAPATLPLVRSHSLIPLLLLLLVAGCGGKGPTHDSVMRGTVSSLQRGVEILKGVSDEPSAIEAKPKLQAVQKELRTAKATLEKLPPPSEKDMARLSSKYEERLDALSSEFERESRRISTDRNVAKHLIGSTSLP